MLDADRRVDAEHALSSVDVAIHSETLRDTAPVLEGIKVKQARRHTTNALAYSRSKTYKLAVFFFLKAGLLAPSIDHISFIDFLSCLSHSQKFDLLLGCWSFSALLVFGILFHFACLFLQFK